MARVPIQLIRVPIIGYPDEPGQDIGYLILFVAQQKNTISYVKLRIETDDTQHIC